MEEYKKTNKLIQDALENPNYESNVFRFPGGSVGGYYDKMKKKAKKVFTENNIAYLDWNAPNKDLTAKTLPDVISYLKEKGYTFYNLYDIL